MDIVEQLAALSLAAAALTERGARVISVTAGCSCYLHLSGPKGLEGLGIAAVEDQAMVSSEKIWFKAIFMGVQITWAEPRPIPAPPASRVL